MDACHAWSRTHSLSEFPFGIPGRSASLSKAAKGLVSAAAKSGLGLPATRPTADISLRSRGRSPDGVDSVRRWRRRWALGHFSLEDKPGRGRKPDFSPSGSSHRQSACLRGCLRDRNALEPPIGVRFDSTRMRCPEKTDQPQYRVAHPPRGRPDTLAVRVLDLSSRSSLCREGGGYPRSLCGFLAGKATWSQRLHREF